MDWNARSGVSVTCGGICDVTKKANGMLIGTENILCDVKADKSTFLGLPIEPPIRTILTVHQARTFSFMKKLDVAGSRRVAIFGVTPATTAVVIKPVIRKLPLKVQYLN